MADITIDNTIQQAGVTAYDSGAGVYTLFVPGAVGAPDLPTHYIQAVTDNNTAAAYVTATTAPKSTAKSIDSTFTLTACDAGIRDAVATTVSSPDAEISFNLTANIQAWAVDKIATHDADAKERILGQYRG